ncbi:MAG: YdcH family protein [Rhodospirillales bacterium]|nr:YdcH family protein [Rhodospirillales bacterium]
MPKSDRVRSLQAKHAKLERELSHEEARPAPSAPVIATLKREKLKIKDELARMSG